MKRTVSGLGLLVIFLSSCTGMPSSASLEGKAAAGNANAACTLVAQDLNTCLAARKKWVGEPGSPRPTCLDRPVSDIHDSYLAKSTERVADPEAARLIRDAVAVTVEQLRFNIGTQDQLEATAGKIASSCSRLGA
jgi:hypothetical protein